MYIVFHHDKSSLSTDFQNPYCHLERVVSKAVVLGDHQFAGWQAPQHGVRSVVRRQDAAFVRITTLSSEAIQGELDEARVQQLLVDT